jgi:hypothetical protein
MNGMKTFVTVALALLAGAGWAPAQREVSVGYLRAALGSIRDRERVAFEADYLGEQGLREARGAYLRNKGFSRFTIRDAASGAVFDSIYCEHGSSVFKQLLQARSTKRFRFEATKGTGEDRKDAIFVTSAVEVRQAAADTPPPPDPQPLPRSLKVTLTDHATSNRTVLVNIELGKTYNLMGASLRIEAEQAPEGPPDAVQIKR